MPVEAYATQAQYAAHLAPIWASIPPENRLAFWAAGGWGDEADTEGVGNRRHGQPPKINGYRMPTMIAGYLDEQVATAAGRPVVYVEHGAGQWYPGAVDAPGREAYSGSTGHDGVELFICPNETVADRWRMVYPSAQIAVVGCPKMDAWHRIALRNRGRVPTPGQHTQPTVAFTFHSDARVCPETETAWPEYEPHMVRVVRRLHAEGVKVIGHGHPRLWQRLERFWNTVGVEPVRDFNDVLRRADLLALDNSSTGPEFASTGRPIVWLNGKHFRRDVSHGGRFWDWTEGIPTVDEPADLADTIIDTLENPEKSAEGRRKMVGQVYAACDGQAAQRAARAVLSLLPEYAPPAPPEPEQPATEPAEAQSVGWPG